MNAVLHAWRSLRPREAAVFVLAAFLFGAIDLTSLLEYRVGERWPQVLARHVLLPQLSGLALLLCWLPAARGTATGAARQRQLVAATLLGSLLGIALTYLVAQALPWPSVCDLMRANEGKPPCNQFRLTGLVGDTMWVFMPALMVVGVLEMRSQRRRQDDAMDALLREHGELRRHALASQLAVLQAQVEPGLLFDALVAVEQRYARGDPEASARLERLIHHLRIALPRLPRPSPAAPGGGAGATLDGEAELIASYLALLRDLDGHPPRFDCELGAQGGRAMPPMLLLPLVQRALRLGRPTRCWLQAGPPLRLGFDAPGLGRDDDELASLRERLAVLGARLACDGGPDRTEFILELPR